MTRKSWEISPKIAKKFGAENLHGGWTVRKEGKDRKVPTWHLLPHLKSRVTVYDGDARGRSFVVRYFVLLSFVRSSVICSFGIPSHLHTIRILMSLGATVGPSVHGGAFHVRPDYGPALQNDAC